MKRSLPTFRRAALATAALLALSPAAMAVDYQWGSGTFVSGVTAPNPLSAGDTLNIVSGGFKYFDGAGFVFTNDGQVVWSTSNSIYMQNGAGVVNNGVWDSTTDSALVHNGGAVTSFVNHGTFRKSGSAGSTTIGINTGFVNNGTLDAQSGSIAFSGGATFNAGSVFSGAGSTVINGGTHAFNGSFTSANLGLAGGVYNGSAAVINGNVGLSGGTLAGGWTVASGAALNLASGGFKYVDGSVVNNGSIDWGTSNSWYLQNSGSFTNNGLFSAAQSASFVHNGGAATSLVNTATGTLRAQAGQTLSLGATLGFVNNGGALDALAGARIAINGGAQLNGGSYGGAGSVSVTGNNGLSGQIDSTNLVITGGTQTGSAVLLNGALGWTGGALAGGWTLGTGSAMTVESGAFKYLDGGSFTNDGTLSWNTTNLLYLQNGGQFVNNQLFVANADTTLANNGGAQPVFSNSAGATLRAAAEVTLNVSNVLVNSGTLDAAAGAAIVYAAGATFNNDTRFTGAGVNRVTGSSTFSGRQHSANLELQGGTYSGSNAALAGSIGWTGGTFAGSWTVDAGTTLSAGTGGFKYLDAGTFTNNGTMAWNTTNLLYMQAGGNWVNNGLFVANADTSIVNNGGAQPILDNQSSGILRAAAGSTLHIGNVLRNHGGRLDAEAGSTIRYGGGAVFNGGTRFTGAGRNLVNGDNGFNGNIEAANLVIESGTQTGTAARLQGTNIGWTGGRLQGGWQLAAGQTITATTGGFKYISGAGSVFDNQGTLVWDTPNLLYLEGTARLQNAGTIDLRNDTQIIHNGGTPTFVNTGLIVKSAGAGTAAIGNGLGFDNQGTLDARSGTLALPGNFVNNGLLTGTGTFAVNGTLTNAGTVAPGASPGTLALAGNYLQHATGGLLVDLQSMASHDLFNVSGSAVLGGTLTVSCFAACSYAVGDVVTILDSVGNLSGSFDSVVRVGFGSGDFDVVYDTVADRVQLLVTQAVTPVPEPASYAMLMAGLAVLGWAARRRAGVRAY